MKHSFATDPAYNLHDEEVSLSRPRHAMPDFVEQALAEAGLTEAYSARPAYQRNDYLGWIIRAKRTETKQRRLQQMLHELRAGGVYMGMAHRPSRITGYASDP